MSFTDSPHNNLEVYVPSIDIDEQISSPDDAREASDSIERIDVAGMSLEQNFDKIEEVARENLEEAHIMAEAVLLQSEYFYKIAGIEGNDLLHRMNEIQHLFDSYFATLEPALTRLHEKIQIEEEINDKMKEANTPEELQNLQDLKQIKTAEKTQSYERMTAMYHSAEAKIRQKLSKYFPTK